MAGTSVRKRVNRKACLPVFERPDANRSRNMAAIRGQDTRPEMIVRRAVHAAGFRYCLHPSGVLGRPDLLLPRYQTVVFVQGCFWHGHDCKIGHLPRTNLAYWKAKIGRNKRRDTENMRILRRSGWVVSSVWECSISQDTAALIRSLRIRRARRTRH